jgi:hypothetical protein
MKNDTLNFIFDPRTIRHCHVPSDSIQFLRGAPPIVHEGTTICRNEKMWTSETHSHKECLNDRTEIAAGPEGMMSTLARTVVVLQSVAGRALDNDSLTHDSR